MKKIALILLAIMPLICLSENNLYVSNPDWWWNSTPANINDVDIIIKPCGSFIEYTFTASFSTNYPDYFSPNDQLEIVMDFDLPNNSLITDSWLWIYGEPKQAEIMDRWTATNIYEQIVNRRKDPSLLVKNGNNQYRINIYPMLPSESRKIMIKYLSPANYNNNKINIDLPLNILSLSETPITATTIWVIDSPFHNTTTTDNSNIQFTPMTHESFGSCQKTVLSESDLNKTNIQLSYNNDQDLNISHYGNETEGFYQFSFSPSSLVNFETNSNKICYLIDFDLNYFIGESDDLLALVKDGISNTLTQKDSFNIIFSNLNIHPVFDTWMPASASNIDAAFDNAIITNYSNFIHLLANGINYINEQEGYGKLMLISNYAEYKNFKQANDIIRDISNLNTNKIPINIVDYSNSNTYYNWFNGQKYWGNEYLFSNIARNNTGEYFHLSNQNNNNLRYQLLTDALRDISGDVITNLDIYTKCNNGFSSGRINFTSGLYSSFRTNKTIHQVGKYRGGVPSMIEVSFEINQKIYHSSLDLSDKTFVTSDSIISTIWHGMDIAQLEGQAQNNQVINEIIYQSIENRILSNYTAFLCVEDSIDLSNIDENNDDEVIVGIDEKHSEDKALKVFPNPFSNTLNIELLTIENLQSLVIYNSMGQIVKEFTIYEDESSYTWDTKDNNGNEIPNGLYLIVANYNDKTITINALKK